jgi:S1-C subfamily serine protease
MREMDIRARTAPPRREGSSAKWVLGAVVASLLVAVVWVGLRAANQPLPGDPSAARLGQRLAQRIAGGTPIQPMANRQGPAPAESPFGPSEVFAKVVPSVVVVHARRGDGDAQGSGVMVAPSVVITNRHVVDGSYTTTVSRLAETFDVTSVSIDPTHDLAVLRVPSLTGESAIMRPSSDLQIGERVFAVGAPRGLELSLAEGLVSSLREYEGGVVIQTTASVSPGSSGGGLFDARGNLIGITTFGIVEENLNFALPAEWAASLTGLSPGSPERSLTAAANPLPRPQVVGALEPAPQPQTEEEHQRARAEAVYRPRMKAIAGEVKSLRTLTRQYFAACYRRSTVRVTDGKGRAMSTEQGGGTGDSSANYFDSSGDFIGSSHGSSQFGWSSVRTQTEKWSEVTTLDNSSTPQCRVMWSDINDILPRLEATMVEAEAAAVKEGVWTWLQRDVPEKLAAELW